MKSKAVEQITMGQLSQNINVDEFIGFLNLHGFTDADFSRFFGVSLQAVRLWKQGLRPFSPTNTKILRLLMKYPHLIQEF